MIALCAVVLVGYGASAFGLFALTVGGLIWLLIWLMIGSRDRHRPAVADLSAREEELKAQSALLQSTLENMGEGLSVFDRNGRLIAWNSRFVELLDLPVDPASGTSLDDILMRQALRGDFGPVDPAAEVHERIERFYRDLPTIRERVTPAGRTLQIRRRAMPDGAVVSLYSDITERKAAEEKMAQAWRQADLANRSKSEFLANMSHELRTPLNAIIGFSEVICGEILGPVRDKKYLEYIKDIHASGLHLLSIISDVLDMSKIEAGKLELASESVTVRRIIAESIRMVSERARSRRLDLATQLPAADIGVCGDERALKQIMLNLLSNAVKFSHEGGRVDIRAALDPARGLVIEVEDYGIGMTPDELDSALQPFGQAKTVATRSYGGTGLGLPIAKGLTEAHGGELVIESNAGRGTLVRIILPPHGAPSVADDPAASRGPNAVTERRAVA